MNLLDFPITPTKGTISSMQKMMKKEYNVAYTEVEAHEASDNLLNFFRLLYKVDQRLKTEKK